MKKSGQVSCPASTGKEKWMKLTGPVTFIYINNNLRSGPILAVLIHSLLRPRAKILFVSPCPPECYLQSKTEIEPDLDNRTSGS